MSPDRRVPPRLPVEETSGQIGDSALVWHVIEDAFWVVATAEDHLDDDFQALTTGQRHLAVLSFLWAEIMSSGVHAMLDNTAGLFVPEAIEAAHELGAKSAARLFEGLVDLVGLNTGELRDHEVRREAPERSSDSAELEALVDPAAEWFDYAEQFSNANPQRLLSLTTPAISGAAIGPK